MDSMNLKDAILELLKRVPCVTKKQLIVFFTETSQYESPVRYLLSSMIKRQEIIERKLSDETVFLTSRRAFSLSEEAVKEVLDCFWLVANMGAENVDLVHMGEGHTRLIWYRKRPQKTDDLLCYDVTFCRSIGHAVSGFNMRLSLGEPRYEVYKHLALVAGREEGEAMREDLTKLKYSHYAYRTEDDHITYVPLFRAETK